MGTMGLAPEAEARAQMVAAATHGAIGKTVAGTIGWQDEPRSEVLSWHTTKKIYLRRILLLGMREYQWACGPCYRESEPAEESLGNGHFASQQLPRKWQGYIPLNCLAETDLKRKSALFGPRGWL